MSERDDIVTRLRTDDASDDLLISAASLLETDDDEIERLRAEVALWHQVWDNVALDVPDLRADNKPLAVAASYELLKREVARLTAERDALAVELKRVQRLPELEWAEACSRIMQVLASAARAGFPVRDSVAVAAMDAGKTYVDRILAERDALLARAEAAEKEAGRYRWLRAACNYSHVNFDAPPSYGIAFSAGAVPDTWRIQDKNPHATAYRKPTADEIDAAIDAAIEGGK